MTKKVDFQAKCPLDAMSGPTDLLRNLIDLFLFSCI